MYKTTEITSLEEVSDNVVHQRQFFAYVEASKLIGGNVLELGCGNGRGLAAVLDVCETYTALDKNTELLSQLAAKHPQHTFKEVQLPSLKEIADNTFDYVITLQVIEHIDDDNTFLKEIYRVLKPGGKTIITTPNILFSLTRNPWHVREYTAEQMKTLVSKHFDAVTLKGVTGNTKVWDYFKKNRDSVRRITRFDILNLQYRLPRRLLQVPYDIMNRVNRNLLLKENSNLVSDVTIDDYLMSDQPEKCIDLFCIAEKKA